MLAVALVLYGFLIGKNLGAYAGGADSSGYLNNAKLLREGRVIIPRRAIEGLPPEKILDYTYVPLGFIPVRERDMAPIYPIGLSIFIAALSPFTGWAASPHICLWLHAMAGVLLMYSLAREFDLSIPLAWLATLLLAACPLYLFMSLQAMSDVPALVWSVAAILAALRSRKREIWALGAGASFALAVLIRPSELLLIAPLAFAFGRGRRRWIWFAIGGLPGAILLGWFNFALYGTPFKSGYGDIGFVFGRDYATLALANYGRWLPVLLTPGLALALGLPWLIWRASSFSISNGSPSRSSEETPPIQLVPLLVLSLWTAGFFGFYAFYYHTHESWWYLRFLLPAFPALILAMVLAGRAFSARLSLRARLVVGVFAAIATLTWDAAWSRHLRVLRTGREEKIYYEATEWARTHLPSNAVIASFQMTGALLYYTDFTFVRCDQFYPGTALFEKVEQACSIAGRPLYAMLFPFEITEKKSLEANIPGSWTKIGTVRQVTIWRREETKALHSP